MTKSKLVIVSLILVTFSVPTLFNSAFAAENDVADGSIVDPTSIPFVEEVKPEYKATLIDVRKKFKVETGEVFKIQVLVRNDSNVSWHSKNSEKDGSKIYLATDKTPNHASVLYDSKMEKKNNGWFTNNRVKLDQNEVLPGEVGSFTFWAKAPDDADVIKEYFTPVVDEYNWLTEASFSIEVLVGDTGESFTTTKKRILFFPESGSAMSVNLNGDKEYIVDLSEQKMTLYLDGKVIREFQVSTGAAKTPTPVGNHKIIMKQEVRIGSKPPHYVMPKFMMFKSGGYALHALPSLKHDGGIFWTEARNHIGRPVSHGCIRMLPEDADLAYEITDIGTKVTVQR